MFQKRLKATAQALRMLLFKHYNDHLWGHRTRAPSLQELNQPLPTESPACIHRRTKHLKSPFTWEKACPPLCTQLAASYNGKSFCLLCWETALTSVIRKSSCVVSPHHRHISPHTHLPPCAEGHHHPRSSCRALCAPGGRCPI